MDLEVLEAQTHLSDGQYGRLISTPEGIFGRSVDVAWHAGSKTFTYSGIISRIGGEFDSASGGVTVYARIADIAGEPTLRPGAFVEVNVPDRIYHQATQLPETALINEDTVFAVVENRLETRHVKLMARVGNDVVVYGEIKDGDIIAATRFPEMGPGVKVRVK
jgi:multidrug efflux pump subunit AcrA (membrane-fusion protein)